LIKTDQFGNEEWSRKFGGIEPDLGYEVIETTDDGYVIVGKTKSYGNGGEDVWLLKLNSEGYVEIEIDINGGFRSSANIKNIGTATAYDVEWSIDLVGGWILIGEHTEDIIDILNPGQSKKVSQDTLFGIGINVKLEVTAGDTTKHAIAKWILGPLVLGI
jgi:hypothetical protein